MQWVKLDSTFYLDAAIIRAGEAAEILFVRAMAWCGDQENDGVVERDVLPRLTPTKGQARAAALVREGLWDVVPEGWRFVSWRDHQITASQIDAIRESGRVRQARKRARDGVSNGVTAGEVTEQSRREETRAAAAAAGDLLDPVVDVLRAKMQAHTRLQALRFDTLLPSAQQGIVELVKIHGDERLVQIALDTCRATPPVHVSAFLGTWAALPAPGERLRDLTPVIRCAIPGHTDEEHNCRQCAGERIAAR